MPDLPSPSDRDAAELTDSLPIVELEVRHGGRNAAYSLSHVDFLIGTVRGCDLRVAGADLPPVLCLLARRPGGLTLRKLAPTQLILVNGETAAQADLYDGDRVTLGATDLFVRFKGASAAPAPRADRDQGTSSRALQNQVAQFRAQVVRFQEERQAFDKLKEQEKRRLQERAEDLDLREQAFQNQLAKAQNAAPSAGGPPVRAPDAPQEIEVEARIAELEKQRQELATMRQELADIRRQLYDRYQERRDRLAGLQEAVDRATRKVQERKRQVDTEEQQARRERQQDAVRRAELDKRAQALEEKARQWEKERRIFQESHAAVEADLEAKLTGVKTREEKLASESRDLEARLHQYKADLVRLDRLQGTLEERERKLKGETEEYQRKLAQLQSDSAELEEQVVELDRTRISLQEEADRFAKQKEEHEAALANLAQRSAAVEGQQATLAALRTRLERTREEVRSQEQQLDQERGRQEAAQAALDKQRQGLVQLRAELESAQQLRDQERQQLAERGAVLEAAVAQLRQAQEKLAKQEKSLEQRGQDLDRRDAQTLEKEGIVEGRLRQLSEAQERLDLERQALRERTQALTETELAREELQEQLRKRSEDLAGRHKALDDRIQDFEVQIAGLEARKAEAQRQVEEAQSQMETWRHEQEAQVETVQTLHEELARREAHHQEQYEQLQKLGRETAAQRKALADEGAAVRQEQEALLERRARTQAELEALRQEAVGLARQLPDVELRAGTALERLTHVREQLRDHLSELHVYVQECREDVENARGRLQGEEARLQEQEQALRRSQEEHRLAMVAFRQQIIGWQGQIVDLRRLLAKDETRLERRQALVEEQAKEAAAASEKLAQKAEALQQERHEVAGKRQEIDRHLVDMREWYRRKLRELAGIDATASDVDGDAAPADVVPMRPASASDAAVTDPLADEDALVPTGRNILSLTEPVDGGDRTLGALLTDLEFIDRDTLNALLVEARRQRRTLRQVLLSSGVVTLYQLALIEAGNVAGLMLGPVRVIDRLRASAHEAVYRVFDPRRGSEAVLRHLAQEEMHDAVRPDEFRQRFTQAMIENPHLSATLEVLDIGGRPAVLQEWLSGLPSSDWPPLAAAPGVCFRLFTQAAVALDAVHKAGLVHGHLSDGSIFLTGEGILKISGVGEPAWLRGQAEESAEASADLRALGQIVSGWCTPTGVRKGPKTKPLPEALVAVLYRLAADGSAGYAGASDLLEDLDRAGGEVPPNVEAWDRLLRYVREHATPEAVLRRSA